MIRFKSDRIEQEWMDQDNIHPKLRQIIYLIDKYITIEYLDYDGLMLTCLNRTQDEQDAIYRNDPAYNKKPWMSVHQTLPCRGADIRTTDMPNGLGFKIVQMLKLITYDPKRPEMETVKYGGDRHKDHIHIQVFID